MYRAQHFVAAILFLLVRLHKLHFVQNESEEPHQKDGRWNQDWDEDFGRDVNERRDLIARGNYHEGKVHDREEALADVEAIFLASQKGWEFHKAMMRSNVLGVSYGHDTVNVASGLVSNCLHKSILIEKGQANSLQYGEIQALRRFALRSGGS